MDLVNPDVIASLLTVAGAVMAAGVVMAVVDALKKVGLGGIVAGHERIWALGLSAGVVVVAVAVGLGETPPRYTVDLTFVIGGAVATYGIWRLALATHDDLSGKVNSITGPPE